MVPLVGAVKPVIKLNTVVLPAPLGPIKPKMPRAGITRLMFCKTCRPPKFFVTDDNVSMANLPLCGAAEIASDPRYPWASKE